MSIYKNITKIKYLFPILLAFFVFFTNNAHAANDDFSLSVWVKPSTAIASKAIVAKAEELRLVTDTNGKPTCQIMSTTWQTAVVSSQILALNEWAHIACVYDLVDLKIFVNGFETGSTALSAVPDDTANALLLGKDASAGTSYGIFSGLIDSFQFFNFAGNIDDIKTLHNSGKSVTMGSTGTDSATGNPTNAASGEYCIPGDSSPCAAPVLHLRMDEKVSGDAKTLYDISGNGNNGTTVDGANDTGMDCAVRGKYGSACEFDGADDDVNFSDITLSNELTLSTWVKFTGDLSDDSAILSRGTADRFYTYNNRIFYEVADNGAQDTGYTLEYNTWHNAVFVRNSSDYVFIYVDGVLVYTSGSAYAGDSVWNNIGSVSGAYPATGVIDDVRIYNYARTPAQIAWDYNKGKPIAEYRFDECQGSTIHDESGNGWNGTLNLGASGVTTVGTCANSASSFWYNGRSGKRNYSGSFDGADDYVQMDNLTLGDSITVSVWAFNSLLSGSWSGRIPWVLNTDANFFSLYFNNGVISLNSGDGVSNKFSNSAPPSLLEWHNYMVIISVSNNDAKLYIDGKYIGSAAYRNPITTNNYFRIAADLAAANKW